LGELTRVAGQDEVLHGYESLVIVSSRHIFGIYDDLLYNGVDVGGYVGKISEVGPQETRGDALLYEGRVPSNTCTFDQNTKFVELIHPGMNYPSILCVNRSRLSFVSSSFLRLALNIATLS